MAETLRPRRVGSREDRNAGRGGFITLKKTGDSFIGFALFTPDPEAADNPGYYEFFEHYTPATGYMPCPGGEDCPLCEEGDSPSTRAKTLWLVDDEVKAFNLNYYMIEDFGDLLSEGDPVLGQAFRIKRQAGNGRYDIRPKTDKLTKAALTKALKSVDENYLENLATKQMKRVLEELDTEAAMTQDEDEEKTTSRSNGSKTSTKTTAKKGTPAAKDEDPEEEPEPDNDEEPFDPEEADSAEDLTVSVQSAKKSQNILVVTAGDSSKFEIYGTDEADLTGYKKGDDLVVSFEKDSDGDFVVSEIGEAQDAPDSEDGNGLPQNIEDEECEVVSVNSTDETLSLRLSSGTEFDLYFLSEGEDTNGQDWSDLDLDDYEGDDVKVIVTAHLDDDGDMLADVFPSVVKAKGAKTAGKRTGRK